MNEIHREKLHRLLRDRRERINSIRHFDEHFDMFIHNILIRLVEEINMELNEMTEDRLKLFMDNPYENRKSRYYVLVQFILGINRNRNFYLDNTKFFPAIAFEGNEVSGKIEIYQKLNNNEEFTKIYNFDARLVDENRISEILIDFIDKIYRI